MGLTVYYGEEWKISLLIQTSLNKLVENYFQQNFHLHFIPKINACSSNLSKVVGSKSRTIMLYMRRSSLLILNHVLYFSFLNIFRHFSGVLYQPVRKPFAVVRIA